jgi:uncharacterized protein (DUF58 family)
MRSRTRGPGYDLAGQRPYRSGDDVRRIDWRASARLSSTLLSDEFVVREHLTEEATAVAVAVDGSPSMRLFPTGLPWLAKPVAAAEVARVVEASARRAGCAWSGTSMGDGDLTTALSALLARERPLAPGSFVFLVSDYFHVPDEALWYEALERGWDPVPVVVQDPRWEQSFPDVAGALVPVADAVSGRHSYVRLTRREIAARRESNAQRLRGILARLDALGLDWALVGSHDRGQVLEALLDWASGRHHGARLAR